MNFRNKRVLVTGSEGFIGSHLVEGLLRKGAKVKAFVLYNSFNSWGWLEELSRDNLKRIEIFLGDVRDPNSVNNAMKQIDTVFHLAALIGIPYSYVSQDAYIDTNIRGALNILQAARRFKTNMIIHTSTSEVFGTAQYVPIDEKHPVNPQSPYAATKASADYLALSFNKSFNLPLTIMRPFNTFGPRQSARAVIPTIISQVLSGKSIIKLGNLETTRDFNYVANLVDAFILLSEAKNTHGNIYNVGSGREASIKEIVSIIGNVLGKKVRIAKDKKRIRPEKSEVKRLVCDSGALKNVCGWQPKVTLEKGIELTCKWFKKNLNKYKPHIYNI
ncbi:MAG: SDR family NAD(P)-dependent oxidoreductase [Candidatus Omnitrophota bacterium]